jgi:hypothetical protein
LGDAAAAAAVADDPDDADDPDAAADDTDAAADAAADDDDDDAADDDASAAVGLLGCAPVVAAAVPPAGPAGVSIAGPSAAGLALFSPPARTAAISKIYYSSGFCSESKIIEIQIPPFQTQTETNFQRLLTFHLFKKKKKKKSQIFFQIFQTWVAAVLLEVTARAFPPGKFLPPFIQTREKTSFCTISC